MTKETTPLWVWLSVALLAIGALTYATAVYFVEYIIGFFSRAAADYVRSPRSPPDRVCRSSLAQAIPSTIMMTAAVSKVGTLPACWMPKP